MALGAAAASSFDSELLVFAGQLLPARAEGEGVGAAWVCSSVRSRVGKWTASRAEPLKLVLELALSVGAADVGFAGVKVCGGRVVGTGVAVACTLAGEVLPLQMTDDAPAGGIGFGLGPGTSS